MKSIKNMAIVILLVIVVFLVIYSCKLSIENKELYDMFIEQTDRFIEEYSR